MKARSKRAHREIIPIAKTGLSGLEKAPTGIPGFDEISEGGLPKGRTTIVCGGTGCGKTMFGIEFLIRGALEFNEPGVLMAFEETPQDIARNVTSLGFDIQDLSDKKKLFLDYVSVEPREIAESGEYDLQGLFIRLQSAVEAVGAKRVMFDTIETIFSGFSNAGVLRAEFRRLFRWLKDRGLTTVITAERGEGTLTRHGLEEYVSDCVILLDHRIKDQISSRRLRIVKYRGTKHGADEYPFLIDERGMSILPVTSLQLQHAVSDERLSSGIPDLDEMLGGKGYFRGSSVLLTGTAGSGKTSLAAAFVDAGCRRGERCLYIDFEESRDQVVRNMKSIGINLDQWNKNGLLTHEAWRPTQFGMEMHLLRIHKFIEKVKPQVVVIDPITNLMYGGNDREAYSMLMRLMDFLKVSGITAVFVSLLNSASDPEQTNVGISSLADTWIMLRDIELNGERNRCLHVLKSRGMAHSHQLREFVLTNQGIKLLPVYLGPGGVLTGSSRVSQESRERAESVQRQQQGERKQQDAERRRLTLQAQLAALQSELDNIEKEELVLNRDDQAREKQSKIDYDTFAKSRGSK